MIADVGHYGEKLFDLPAPDIPIALRRPTGYYDASAEEVCALSRAFLEERRASLGRLGEGFAHPPDATLAVLPSPRPIALFAPQASFSVCVVSIGLLALVRHQSILSVWRDRIGRLPLEKAPDQKLLSNAVGLMNLRAVLFLLDESPLTPIEETIDSETRRLGFITAEVCMAFILGHELGHIAYRDANETAREVRPSLVVSEIIDAAKREEFYADASSKATPLSLASVRYPERIP